MTDELTYSDIVANSQPLIWKLFKYDSAIREMTSNVLDKEPEKFNEGVGYPLFIIPEAQVSDSIVGLRKHELTLFFNCATYALRTNVLHDLDNAIRACLAKNRVSLMASGLCNGTIDSHPKPYPLDDGRLAYRSDVVIRFKTVVDGAPSD